MVSIKSKKKGSETKIINVPSPDTDKKSPLLWAFDVLLGAVALFMIGYCIYVAWFTY